MSADLPYDWTYLAIRIVFIGLVYLFLWRVARVTLRDLTEAAAQGGLDRKAQRYSLVVLDPADADLPRGTAYRLAAKNVVGRHPECTIVIDEPSLSAFHAEMLGHRGQWSLSDLGSTNGTLVNGTPVIGSVPIFSGDVVQLGRIKLQVTA